MKPNCGSLTSSRDGDGSGENAWAGNNRFALEHTI